MRVELLRRLNPAEAARLERYAADLTDIGEGVAGETVEVPEYLRRNYYSQDPRLKLINDVFSDISTVRTVEHAMTSFGKRAILTPKNKTVTNINLKVR